MEEKNRCIEYIVTVRDVRCVSPLCKDHIDGFCAHHWAARELGLSELKTDAQKANEPSQSEEIESLKSRAETAEQQLADSRRECEVYYKALCAVTPHLPNMIQSADIRAWDQGGENSCCSTRRICAKCAYKIAKEAFRFHLYSITVV